MSSPTVSVIMPTYNEAAFVEDAVASVMDDAISEMLVVDGGSTDGTREIVAGMLSRYPRLRLVDNPRRVAASAMNIGLAQATGELIVRLDAHAVYPRGYVARLAAVLAQHEADVTGGMCVAVPRRGSVLGRSFAATMGNKWVMGGAAYKVGGGDVRPVDTVPFGCWRADTLRRAGGFNEELLRSQDFELSQRLRSMGATILLVPDVVIQYMARSGIRENARHNFSNGFWVGYPWAALGLRFSARHLLPGGACLGGVALVAASVVRRSPRPMALALPYLAVLSLAARQAADQGPAVVAVTPLVTAGIHVSYGLGTLWGLVRGGIARIRRRSVREPVRSAPPTRGALEDVQAGTQVRDGC